MCGICGTIGFDANALVEKMNRRMAHRGPDDSGIYQDKKVALGHNRLSIIDPSSSGHQPMCNEDGNVWVVFNGAIYNFLEIKKDLAAKGHRFKSKTDTEVIPHLYEEYGIGCLVHLRGMFSFAVWDKRKERLFAARDRFGIKPFFYCRKDDRLVFSSELKAILSCGFVDKDIDTAALEDYLAYGFVRAPSTIIKDVLQLLPAHYLIFENSSLSIKRYWGLDPIPEAKGLQKKEKEYISVIRTILEDAVKMRLVSDVPLGVFLSGGIDSSVIAALTHRCSDKRAKTFSIVFDETCYDEREFSRKIAKTFDTDHKEILVKEKDILRDMPAIFNSMDQPSVDGFNTFVISKAVKEAGITVALSGLGGDELFAGYPSFKTLPRLYQVLKFAKVLPRAFRTDLFEFLKPLAGSKHGLKCLFSIFGCDSFEDIYYLKRSVFLPYEVRGLLVGAVKNKPAGTRTGRAWASADPVNKLSYLEITNYLQDMLLQDTDRMSMANSLEVRAPYLDHVLVEKVFEIPGYLKVGRDYKKRLLVKATKEMLPEEIYERPKMGFVFPFESWLKGPLKDYCEEKFSKTNLKAIPLLNTDVVCGVWSDFLKSSPLYNYSSILSLLSFINWYEGNIPA